MLQNRLSSSLQKKSPLKNSISKKWLGSISFEESLKEQEELKSLAQKGRFYFLGFEPRDTVITKGLRSDSKDILWDSNQLKKHSIQVLSLKRGGQATLHSRGQLVLYPVVSLPLIGIKVKDFIVLLESITQAVLKDLNIDTKRLE
ncbi:MAG: lipoyl protein ligase domain-containing protein, partial [Bdellovibrionales bacterium]